MEGLEISKYYLEFLKGTELRWLAIYIAAAMLTATAISYFALLFYSKPVIKLRSDIKQIFLNLAAKLKEEMTSPYAKKIEDNKYLSVFIIGYFYSASIILLFHFIVFILIAAEVGINTNIIWYKQLLSLCFGFLMLCCSILMKSQGDKLHFKLKNNKC